MAVLLHPNKTNPKRYRVWDKETRTQVYFPLTPQGKKDALEKDAKVQKVKQARQMSKNLSINKLFAPDGSVKGMKRLYRVRSDRPPYECLRIYAAGKYSEIVIGARGFDSAFERAVAWMMKRHNITPTLEIKQMLKKARRFYWDSAKPD